MPGSRISTRFRRCLIALLSGRRDNIYYRKDVEVLTA